MARLAALEPGHLPPGTSQMERFQGALLATLERAEFLGYCGYSKFDGLRSPVTRALSFGWWPLRLVWTQLVMRAPVNIRPVLAIYRGINPEGLALFAQANLTCMEMGWPGTFGERARRCLDALVQDDASSYGSYHGRCWGYQHPWQSPGFYQPPHFPNCYITVIVGSALLCGYRLLQDSQYLEVARSAADFLLQDLQVFSEDAETKCIAYVPHMRAQLQVININALAGAFLAQVGAATGESVLLTQARKLMTFVARSQTSYGAWYYAMNPQHSLVTHDNYHTGMILDALMNYAHSTGDESFVPVYRRGLDYYRQHLFLSTGAPRWSSTCTWPHDVHGSAQGTLTFALAGELDLSRHIAAWALEHFYKGQGDFAYQQGRIFGKRFTLLHWCNGWMARGLAALLLACRR
ncbi:MAG: hypothetical protein AB7N91_26465 [Candidatus Tectimicrobiota bacterium]